MDREQIHGHLEKLNIKETDLNLLETVSSCIAYDADVTTGDFLEGIASLVADKVGLLGEANDKLQTGSSVLSKIAVLEIADHVFSLGSGISHAFSLGSGIRHHFKLAKIMKIIQEINKKLDIVLDTPLKFKWMSWVSR